MKKWLLLTIMTVMSFGVWAQGPEKEGRRFDPEQFRKMVEESLTKAASLTPGEAKAFFPLYNEMRQKQREMGEEIRKIKKEPGSDEKAIAQTVVKINQRKVDMAKLEQDYYNRFLKVIPAEKVFKIIKAEDDFHRRMVQGRRGNGGPNKKKGQRQSRK